MKKGEVNFIVLNYYMLVKGDEMLQYVHAFTNTSTIGRLLGNFLSNYTPKIQTIDQIHLIGHSMGAQIMSYTAKNFGAGILRLSGTAYNVVITRLQRNFSPRSCRSSLHSTRSSSLELLGRFIRRCYSHGFQPLWRLSVSWNR